MDLRGVSAHSDAQNVRRWAAEHFAISIGLLRECPYHGEPFKARPPLSVRLTGASLPDASDPLVKAYGGSAQALFAAARRLSVGYRDSCPHCAASEEADLED
jgi:hypothetical protein